MKTITISILFNLIASSNMIYSQWTFGLQGGVNIGKFEVENLVEGAEVSYKSGLIISGIINYELFNEISLQIEPRYIQKNHEVEIVSDDFISTTYGDYLELPINLIYKLNSSKIAPFLLGGISFGYLLNIDATVKSNNSIIKLDSKNKFSDLDISLGLGAGLKYVMNKRLDVVFDARYSLGITNISPNDYGEINTRGIQLLVGALYKL